eukprot:CAMPEP_0114541902 /NCGR_PEP_ID=MMETSP0114-20121206/1552_1 /TAXON_ID=31324 /ORGANISM="Goniomonas sp, Strain m" /LENGTH=508 /DNA_ID=CAMNT_0001726169 /DNA_START=103 /DNA_END=1630 /DNA_ORIENTATION=+
MILTTIPYNWYSRKTAKTQIELEGKLSDAGLLPALDKIRIVRQHGAEKLSSTSFHFLCEKLFRVTRRLAIATAFYTLSVGFLSSGGLAVSLWRAAGMVISGNLSQSQLVIFFLYVDVVYDNMDELFEARGEYNEMVAAASYLFEFVDEACERSDAASEFPMPKSALPDRLQGAVQCQDLTFEQAQGASGRGAATLRSLSFSLAPGEKLVLIGPRSIGLEAVFDLFLCFHEPQKGLILLDGIPTQELPPSWVRDRVALVSANDTVFSGTVRENLCCGLSRTDAELEEAAQRVGVLSAITRLVRGLDTVLTLPGESAGDDPPAPFSQGQDELDWGERRLLCIARSLLKNPTLVLVDGEVLSCDAEGSLFTLRAVNELCSGRTTIVTSHWALPSCEQAHMVGVLDDQGSLLEYGPPATLMETPGSNLGRMIRHSQESTVLARNIWGPPAPKRIEVRRLSHTSGVPPSAGSDTEEGSGRGSKFGAPLWKPTGGGASDSSLRQNLLCDYDVSC